MLHILFICHGNICRSPMAEYLMAELLRREGLDACVAVASAAVSDEESGNDMSYPARLELEKRRIPAPKRAARQLIAADGERFDLLIGMDRGNLAHMQRICPDAKAKMSLLLSHCGEVGSVADPWYTHNYAEAFSDIRRGCLGLLKEIKENIYES